jgi:hypothetical protein
MTKREKSRKSQRKTRSKRKFSKSRKSQRKTRSKRKFSKKKSKIRKRTRRKSKSRRSFSFSPFRKRSGSRSDNLDRKRKSINDEIDEEGRLVQLLEDKEQLFEEIEWLKCYIKSRKVRGKDIPKDIIERNTQMDENYGKILSEIKKITNKRGVRGIYKRGVRGIYNKALGIY